MSKTVDGPKFTPLRRMANDRGLRMDHVARLAGVKPWTLSKIASGEHSAPPLFFERLAVFLHCTPDDIRPEQEEPVAA